MGWVQSAHGIKGELEIRIASGDSSWLGLFTKEINKKTATVQLNELPYACDGVRKKQDLLLLRLRGIEDRTKAETFKSSRFAIPERYLVSKPGETIYLSEILDFAVLDHGSVIGKVYAFSSNGPQDLLQVKADNDEIYEIPFVAPFIQEIDFTGRCLHLQLPPGLLEINRK